MLTFLRNVALMAIGLPLAGCVSGSDFAAAIVSTAEYKPDPGFWTSDIARSGYSEQKVDPETWKVGAIGNTVTDPRRIALIANTRAAEIGKLNGFGYFKVVDRDEKLGCTFRRGSATLAGVAQVDLTVKYAKTAAPDYGSVEQFLAENLQNARASVTTPEERARAHDMMQIMCDQKRTR